MERTALVCSDRNLKVHGPLWPVGTKCSFPFDQTVVPRTALLYPAYKNSNQTRGGLGRVRATGVTVPFHWARGISEIEFQTGILFNRKRPFSPQGLITRTGSASRTLLRHQQEIIIGPVLLCLMGTGYYVSPGMWGGGGEAFRLKRVKLI